MTSTNKLPKLEIYFYTLSWTLGVLYSLYHVYLIGDEITSKHPEKYRISEGWRIISRWKDPYDEEWLEWKDFLLYKYFFWVILHHLVSRILYFKLLPLWYFTITSLYIVIHFGVPVLILLLLQPVLFILLLSVTNSPVLIWVLCCILAYSLGHSYPVFLYSGLHGEDFISVVIAIMWLYLRCISFSMFTLSKRLDWSLIFSFIGYTFYFPCFFLGPIILYDEFHEKLTFKSTKNSKSFCWIIFQNLRYFGWLLFTEFLLHYLYVTVVEGYLSMWKDDVWILYGFGFSLGQFFFLKYIVTFGLAITWTKAEGFNAPNPPKCIACISLYSEMWRNFDQGLYLFIKKYIYEPCLGRSKSLFSKIWACFVSFVFVFAWHGVYYYILKWAALNFIGIVIEIIARSVSKTNAYHAFKNFVGYSNERRFLAFISAPLSIMSAVSNFYFIGSNETAEIYFDFLFQRGSLLRISCLWFFVYALCHVSRECKSFQISEETKVTEKLLPR